MKYLLLSEAFTLLGCYAAFVFKEKPTLPDILSHRQRSNSPRPLKLKLIDVPKRRLLFKDKHYVTFQKREDPHSHHGRNRLRACIWSIFFELWLYA